jgi:hypothetical protein
MPGSVIVTGHDQRGHASTAGRVARIQRQQEEVRLFAAEKHRLTAEASKRTANQRIARWVTAIASVCAAAGARAAA